MPSKKDTLNPAEIVEPIPPYSAEELLSDPAKRAHLISALRANRAKFIEKEEAKTQKKRTVKEAATDQEELKQTLGETTL